MWPWEMLIKIEKRRDGLGLFTSRLHRLVNNDNGSNECGSGKDVIFRSPVCLVRDIRSFHVHLRTGKLVRTT